MSGHRTNTLLIRTPEGIEFSLPLAGPVTRFFSWAIDLACVIAITSTLGTLFQLVGLYLGGIAFAAGVLFYFAVSIGYGIVTEWFWRGQTLGKRLMRLRVVDAQGLHLQFSQVVIRNLLRFIDGMPVAYFVGGVACLVSKRCQRLGDFAANTIVIRIQRSTEPDLKQIESDKYNSLRDYPHLEARLRQCVSQQEAGIALQALLRREQLEPDARVELFTEIAAHFKAVVAFPEEVTIGVADEQYVRNVVDTLFRK